jgi:hypothetical protein
MSLFYVSSGNWRIFVKLSINFMSFQPIRHLYPLTRMKQDPSWESNSRLSTQEISHDLWNSLFQQAFTRSAACPYPEPDKFSLQRFTLYVYDINVILPSSRRFSYQNFVCILLLPFSQLCIIHSVLLYFTSQISFIFSVSHVHFPKARPIFRPRVKRNFVPDIKGET